MSEDFSRKHYRNYQYICKANIKEKEKEQEGGETDLTANQQSVLANETGLVGADTARERCSLDMFKNVVK